MAAYVGNDQYTDVEPIRSVRGGDRVEQPRKEMRAVVGADDDGDFHGRYSVVCAFSPDTARRATAKANPAASPPSSE